MSVALSETGRDRLRRMVSLWKEEIRVHGPTGTGRSLLTVADLEALQERIERLLETVRQADAEFWAIVGN